MEWYESLFQQVCAYLLVRARTAHNRREDGMLIADQAGLHELISSYGVREIKVVFEISGVMPAFDGGTKFVMLINVRESIFHKTAQELLRDRWRNELRQILAATMESGSVHPLAPGHQFDVVICHRWAAE